jgi:hypothetical protein
VPLSLVYLLLRRVVRFIAGSSNNQNAAEGFSESTIGRGSYVPQPR